MKPTTQIIVGIRHVGAPQEEIQIESMSVENAIRKLAIYLLETTLAQRIQVSIGRSETDVKVGLLLGNQSKTATRTAKAESLIDSIFADFEDQDSGAKGENQ